MRGIRRDGAFLHSARGLVPVRDSIAGAAGVGHVGLMMSVVGVRVRVRVGVGVVVGMDGVTVLSAAHSPPLSAPIPVTVPERTIAVALPTSKFSTCTCRQFFVRLAPYTKATCAVPLNSVPGGVGVGIAPPPGAMTLLNSTIASLSAAMSRLTLPSVPGRH